MLVPLGRFQSWAAYAVAAAVSAFWTGGALAAAITDIVPLPDTFTTENGTDAYVPRFDPALGTLTAVSARLTGVLKPGLANLQNATLPFTSPILFSPTVFVAFPMGGTQSLPTESAPITTVAGDEQATGAPEAVDLTSTYPPTLPEPGFPPVLDFAGTGTTDFYVRGTSGAPRLGVDVSDVTTLTGQVAVTYTYAPAAVPEPKSAAVLGAGLVGLALAWRRKPG